MVPEVEISSNYHSGALLGKFLQAGDLLLPNTFIPIQAFIVNATHDQVPTLLFHQFGKEHAPAHQAVGEGDFEKPALILGQDEGVVPPHRDHPCIVLPYPTILGQGVQQMHKLAGYFLQANEVAVAELQDLQNALISRLFVVRLKPNVICEHRYCFRKSVGFQLFLLQLALAPEMVERVLVVVAYFLIQQ